MNKKTWVLVSTGVIALAATSIGAWAGGGAHGGDTQCDAKIQSIAENIKTWIKDHGPEVGKLDLSTSKNPTTGLPYTLDQYDVAMLDLLAKPLGASCVSKGDHGYPVQVGDSSKVCRNQVDSSGIHMICDLKRIKDMSADERIQQIHHEFATDVPGLEPDDGPISSYKISLQLAAFIQDVPERRLVVGAPSTSVGGSPLSFVSIPLNNYCGIPLPAGLGCFLMGSPRTETGHHRNEQQHQVILKKQFSMETTPVTQLQWYTVMGTNPSHFTSDQACPGTSRVEQGSDGSFTYLCPDNPVESVRPNDIGVFIEKLNAKHDGYQYSLPTEAQWEYSARAGTSTAYYFGDDVNSLVDHAWYSVNSSKHTHEVGQKGANGFGLYDMEGNVWQWVQDFYASDYEIKGNQIPVDPIVPRTRWADAVVRGGSWNVHFDGGVWGGEGYMDGEFVPTSTPSEEAARLRSASRKFVTDPSKEDTQWTKWDHKAADLGFRLVRTPLSP